MQKPVNERLKEVLDYLLISPHIPQEGSVSELKENGFDITIPKPTYETREGMKKLFEVQDDIRKILGFDKQCFQCLDYKLDTELKLVESTDRYVCQECAEKIIAGVVTIREI